MKTVHEMSEQITFLAFTQPSVAFMDTDEGNTSAKVRKENLSDDVWKLYNV